MSKQQRRTTPYGLVAFLSTGLTVVLLFEGLRIAAWHDRHWRTGGMLVDHRTGAGSFLVAGLVAGVPALTAGCVLRGFRRYLFGAAAIAVVVAAVCEAFVSLVPEPYVTF